MSYVELKHRLADLTLEAVADPEAAEDWVERLVQGGILERTGNRVALRAKYQPHRTYFERHAGRLRSFLAKYRALQPPAHAEPGPLRTGVLLFNEGLYFECHEWLEAAWKRTAGPEKNFLHGIVQAAAAFYHYEKGNMHGARTLLGKALKRLASYPSPYFSVDLDEFRTTLAQWQAHFMNTAFPEADVPIIKFIRS